MTRPYISRSRAARRSGVLIAILFCAMAGPIGCGDPGSREMASLPPPEFVEKLEKEHPELFQEKNKKGKVTGEVGGRDRRAIIRREYTKALESGTQ